MSSQIELQNCYTAILLGHDDSTRCVSYMAKNLPFRLDVFFACMSFDFVPAEAMIVVAINGDVTAIVTLLHVTSLDLSGLAVATWASKLF